LNRLVGLRAARLLGLLGEKNRVDVRDDTTGSDGDTGEQLVKLLIVADSQLDVTRDDAVLLVVTSGVARKLENFSSQVLHDGSEVHGGTGADAGSVAALTEVTVHTADGELETGLGRTGGGLASLLLRL
jgi:hypothetical protein